MVEVEIVGNLYAMVKIFNDLKDKYQHKIIHVFRIRFYVPRENVIDFIAPLVFTYGDDVIVTIGKIAEG